MFLYNIRFTWRFCIYNISDCTLYACIKTFPTPFAHNKNHNNNGNIPQILTPNEYRTAVLPLNRTHDTYQYWLCLIIIIMQRPNDNIAYLFCLNLNSLQNHNKNQSIVDGFPNCNLILHAPSAVIQQCTWIPHESYNKSTCIAIFQKHNVIWIIIYSYLNTTIACAMNRRISQ